MPECLSAYTTHLALMADILRFGWQTAHIAIVSYAGRKCKAFFRRQDGRRQFALPDWDGGAAAC